MLKVPGTNRFLFLPCRFIGTSSLPTIYALSTPPGQRSAIAVVRISGNHSKYILRRLTNSEKEPVPRVASLRRLYHPDQKRNLLDTSLTLFFESPKTFTGEDILELHLHGGKAVTGAVLKAIESLHDLEKGFNIRYANPGEFSLRAFQNGKFDLTEVEGIKELIDAETETQRKSALSSFNGENKSRFLQWRSQIVDNIAKLTAIIDFGEDTEIEDIESILTNVESDILQLRAVIRQFIEKIERSNILRNGIRIVLLGPPNAGKSSLINTISQDDISIVSQIPGTTRDAIEIALNIGGYKVIICDTAGVRDDSSDAIEKMGIEKALKKSESCNLCLLLVDPNNTPLIPESLKRHLASPHFQSADKVILINKIDTISPEDLDHIVLRISQEIGQKLPILPISCLSGEGIENLATELITKFQLLSDSSDESNPIIVSQRVREILSNDVLYGIDEFLSFKKDVVMASESLRHAATGIGKITGEAIGVEEVLGVVFSSFCVGK
ncbi:hypothetical protein HG536_0G01150 [Torulaspora globosa]|uniref:TrmE-type G domain-containing protein n=1 Tax=Torulaspora globosa TaxID=48254 RepID=A0A7G3ZL70_9SACH|nr:uncharacterized protein HG536_0G01150 [Torulaspora globosa]QLL34256.1 hypothetical protein HG536_0G01150 [Torulaspora globosa]